MLLSLPILTTLILGVSASNVVDLIPGTFDEVIGKGTPALVEFFAPWCGHCKNLAPTYEQLADSFAHAKDKVVIAKVDADGEGKDLGKKYGVTGFPTLKWFDAEGNHEPYEAGRDLDSLSAFVTKKSNAKSNIKPPPPSAVEILDAHNFGKVALDEDKYVIVSFTAPWCGHCKNLKPIWEKVATTFKPEGDCIVATIDADDKKNSGLGEKYGVDVKGYPTIVSFAKGSAVPENYEGGRSEAEIVSYLNEKCGTQRAVGGGLNDQAGRFPELDSLAIKFFSAGAEARDQILKETSELATTIGAASNRYLSVMEKIVNGSETYIQKEASRLAKILEKRNMSPSKLDEFKIKANILKAFIERKTGEAEEKVGRDEAEL